MKSQYYIKVKYNYDGHERWELTEGKFANENAARKAYEARGKAMNFTILKLKKYEHFHASSGKWLLTAFKK
tara:strand:- start:101 stop:313 length:213 start_codon:yes stop_codon:yes gene_type:complete